MKLSIHTDGGSRGNPGHAGYGYIVYDDNNNPIQEGSGYIGIKTNNEAEYAGLLAALTWLKSFSSSKSIDSADFFLDSELLVRQVNGYYKVKSPHLIPIYTQVKNIISSLPFPINFHHVFRDKNSAADKLANLAMDHGSTSKN